MNNIKCPSCGEENNAQSNFCIQCGSKLVQDNSEVVEQKIENSVQNNEITTNNQVVDIDESDARGLGIVSLVLFFAGSAIFYLLSLFFPGNIRSAIESVGGLCPLTGIVVMIVGRIRYPKNGFLKTVMWIIIGTIIFVIVSMIILVITCIEACSGLAYII